MLQSPTSLFPDPCFRLQSLMHGRGYLSPITNPSGSHQTPGGVVDPAAQYRGLLCHQNSHRLPHYTLAIPPSDILPHGYQPPPPHVAAFSQPTGFAAGLMPVRRTPLQPTPLESYSQTLFNLSQQSHHLQPQGLSHPGGGGVSGGGLALQQQEVRPALSGVSGSGGSGLGLGDGTGRDVPEEVRPESFSLHGMPAFFDVRGPQKTSAPELSLKSSNHRVRQLQIQSKLSITEDAQNSGAPPPPSSLQHSQASHHAHHLQHLQLQLLSRLPRLSTIIPRGQEVDDTPIHNNNNNINNNNNNSKGSTPVYFMNERLADDATSWKAPIMHRNTLEMEFFKDPNAVGIQNPPDRNHHPHQHRNGLNRYASIPAVSRVSPSVMHGSIHSPVSFSAASAAVASAPHPHQEASSCGRLPSVGYHRHFSRGSVIQLASGQLKRVEDLITDDFLDSCGISADLSIDTSRVTHLRLNHDNGSAVIGFSVGKKQMQVSVEATVEHPFFVFNRGWSSCCPSKTFDRYGLPCHQLTVGDICISLTHKCPPDSPGPSTDPSLLLHHHQQQPGRREKTPTPPLLDESSSCLCPSALGNLPASQRREDESLDQQSVVSTGQATGRSGSRKRRWSAPDKGSSSSCESPSGIPNNVKAVNEAGLTSLPSSSA